MRERIERRARRAREGERILFLDANSTIAGTDICSCTESFRRIRCMPSFHLQQPGLGPAAGHSGFQKVEFGHEHAALRYGSYFHYLHHRYFECNCVSDEDMFLDKLFGSMHDGTPEAHAKMRARAHNRIRERKIAAESPPA